MIMLYTNLSHNVRMSTEFAMATDKQMAFIDSLMTGRVVTDEQRTWYAANRTSVDKRQASRIIDALLTAPKMPQQPAPSTSIPSTNIAPLPDVLEGRYAIEEAGVLKFYIVDKPTEGRWAGRTFVSVMASDERWPVKNPDARRAVLMAIAADPQAAAIRFGKELGKCSICGRTLTDEESRNRGIGPVCAEKRGW